MSLEKEETAELSIEESTPVEEPADLPDVEEDASPEIETSTKPSRAKIREKLQGLKKKKTEEPEPDTRNSERPDSEKKPPSTELRLRRLPPLEPDRSRVYGFGAIGALVLVGVGLIAASPHKSSPDSPSLALTSSDIDAGTAAVNVVERKDSPPADAGPPAPVVRPPPAWRAASLKDDPNVEYTEGNFGKKGLVATLTAAGLARSEIKRLNRAFEDVKRIDRPSAGDRFALAKDRKGNVVAFEYITSPFDVYQVRADADDKDAGAKAGELDAKKLDFFVEHKHQSSAFVVEADLAKTIATAKLRPELVDEIDDALEGHIEDGIKSGARMRIVSTEDVVDGNTVRTKLDAVELIPRSGNNVRVYYYERGSDVEGSSKQRPAAGFYDSKGRQPYHGQFRPPLVLSRITSRFNPNRMHPVLHVVMPHNGVDYAGSTGTPIYAAASGTIISAGDSGPCGNMVSIDHGGGLTTAYCHMSRIAPGIHAGMKVEQRQNIGFVGQTGRVTGPHLHFVVKRNGNFIDPQTLKMDGVRVLPPADRDAFTKKRNELDSSLDGAALPAAPVVKDEPDVDEDKDPNEQ
jgi:murein DD-endopeptidase MepM/ murein hydrolase activator NlpD